MRASSVIHFAEGSSDTHEACDAVCASFDRVTELARLVSDEMEEITANGVPLGPLAEDDSMVVSVETAIRRRRVVTMPPSRKTDDDA